MPGGTVRARLEAVVRRRLTAPHARAHVILALGAAAATATFALVAADRGDVASDATGLLLALAVVVGAAVAGLSLLEPWPGLVAWLVAMPLLNAARLGLTVGGVLVTHTTVLLACLAIGTWISTKGPGRLAPRLPRSAIVVAGAISILALMSGLGAPDRSLGATIGLHGLVEPAILAVVAIVLLDRPWRVAALGLAMAASVTIATGYNLERLAKIASDLATAQSDRAGFARFTYYNVGIYGDMLVMSLPLAIGALVYARARLAIRPVRLGLLGMIVLLTLGLYLTFTKGPWLAGLIAVSALLVAYARSWRPRLAILVGAAVVLALIVPYPLYLIRALTPSVADQALTVVSTIQGGDRADSWDPETAEGEVSITERFLATRAAVAMAIDHPLLGLGPGGFAGAYATRYHPAAATRALQSPHDLIADLAAEFGLPLTAIIVVVLAGAAIGGLRVVRRGPPGARTLALAFGAGLGAFIVVGFTFGIDLYRPWRVMNSDVLFAALLCAGLVGLARSRETGRGIDAGGRLP